MYFTFDTRECHIRIEILKVGSNAAEKALLDADQLLDSAVAGKLPNNGQKNNYWVGADLLDKVTRDFSLHFNITIS